MAEIRYTNNVVPSAKIAGLMSPHAVWTLIKNYNANNDIPATFTTQELEGAEVDPVFTASPAGGISAGQITNWDNVLPDDGTSQSLGTTSTWNFSGGGAHPIGEIIMNGTDAIGAFTVNHVGGAIPKMITDLNAEFLGGKLESEFLTGFTESDPIFVASPAAGISAGDITGWDAKLDAESTPVLINGAWTWSTLPAFNGGTSGATAPFTVDSTFLVTNLNAGFLEGNSASAFEAADTHLTKDNVAENISGLWDFQNIINFDTSLTVGAGLAAVTETVVGNWNTAYGWGNHASAGYIVNNGTEVDINVGAVWNFDGVYGTIEFWSSDASNPFTVHNSDGAGATGMVENLNAEFLGGLDGSTFGDLFAADNETITGDWVFNNAGETFVCKGDAVGASNQTYISFKDSADTTQGRLGMISTGSDAIYLRNIGSGQVILGTNNSSDMTMVSGGATTFVSTVTATNFIDTSDRRKKKKIKNIPNSKIKALSHVRPVKYKLKDGDGAEQYGVIAQEIDNVYPELVTKGEDGMLGVDYRSLFMLEFAKVQELEKRLQVIEDKFNG